MPETKDVEDLIEKIEEKTSLDDYDLGVYYALRWVKGDVHPYYGRKTN